MNLTDWIGSIGVFILLLAYFMQLRKILDRDNILYLSMNIAGALMACLASYLLKYWPFIVLEASWCGVSCLSLINLKKRKKLDIIN